MAHNIQDDAEDYPDLTEVLERSRDNWLDGQDVHQMFSHYIDPEPCLQPVAPFEEGLFFYLRTSQLDTNDWSEQHHKRTRENPNPMRYWVARLYLEPIALGILTTYERRIYQPRPMFQQFKLVHYRIRHTSEIIDSGDDVPGPDPGHVAGGNAEDSGNDEAGVGDDADDHADSEVPPAPPLSNGHSSRVFQTCVKYCSDNFDAQKSKKPKLVSSNSHKKHHTSQNQNPGDSKFLPKSFGNNEKTGSLSKKESRIQAKLLTEASKKKRKPHYTLEQEFATLWEKMRRFDISKEDRSKLIAEAVQKMKGKIPDIAEAEKEAVFKELQPHFLRLASNAYAVHLLKKMMDGASKPQLAACISCLRGKVATLLRHLVGSVVVEHAYHLGTAALKRELLGELYSKELQLFKGMTTTTETRVVDIIAKLRLQKSGVMRRMTSIVQPILEKGIVDHTITHKLLIVYLTIADKNGRRPLVELLHPSFSRYFSHDDLASLDIPSLSLMDKSQSSSQTKDSDSKESGEEAKDEQEEIDLEENVAVAGGKKDPLLRRQELLVTSGLAEAY